MNRDAPRPYAWVDLETTGSDEARDKVLEVGIALSDPDFAYLAGKAWVLHATPLDREAAPVRVREMHDRSGLWEAAFASNLAVDAADREIHAWLREYTGHDRGERRLVLAGSGVGHFDSRFIRRHLPTFDRWLTFWTLDVGVVRRFLPLCGFTVPGTEDGKPHRALADAMHHLDEAILYRDLVRQRVPMHQPGPLPPVQWEYTPALAP